MPNEMRERMIELICESTQTEECIAHCNHPPCRQCANTADYLLSNGVIVPPCKVGDTVYVLMETSCEDIDGVHTTCEFYTERRDVLCSLPKGKCPYKYRIEKCLVTDFNLLSFTERWGKTVFITFEQAEQALKGGDTE